MQHEAFYVVWEQEKRVTKDGGIKQIASFDQML